MRFPIRVRGAPSRGKSGARAESRAESLDARVLAALGGSELSKAEVAERLHLRTVSGQLNRTIWSLVRRGLLPLGLPQIGFGKSLLDPEHLHAHHSSARVEVEVVHNAQEAARRRLEAISSFAVLPIEPGVEELAGRYYEAISLPGRDRADSLHLALAAWHGVDFLVSWNCTHIASGRVRRILESVNRELRIRMPDICTPYELMEDEDDS